MRRRHVRAIRVEVQDVQLASPYVLSFRTLPSFETILVAVELTDGECLRGEVVPLPGYGHEDVADVVGSLQSWIHVLVGMDVADARTYLNGKTYRSPFAASAALGAFDQALVTRSDRHISGRVPLVFPLSSKTDPFERTVQSALSFGYRTLKVKVGFDLADDILAVRRLARILPPGIAVRFDANGAMAPDEASAFCDAVYRHLRGVTELLEQPFAIDAWGETEALAARSRIPLMIDESIRTPADIDRAAQSGARLIKLKLCKQGSIPRLLTFARRARRLGLGVVLGNGVATDLSNRLELWTAARYSSLFTGASEANGFVKLRRPLWHRDLSLQNGDAIW